MLGSPQGVSPHLVGCSGEADGITGNMKDGEEMSPKTTHNLLEKSNSHQVMVSAWIFKGRAHPWGFLGAFAHTHANTRGTTMKTGSLDS